jgi:hypothetical protein
VGTVAATEWLDRLERVDARIIVLALNPVGFYTLSVLCLDLPLGLRIG